MSAEWVDTRYYLILKITVPGLLHLKYKVKLIDIGFGKLSSEANDGML